MGTFDDVFQQVKKPADPKPAAGGKPEDKTPPAGAAEGTPKGKVGPAVGEAFKKTFGERKS
jgi:hypothetical protein